jgi:hypothetical protein
LVICRDFAHLGIVAEPLTIPAGILPFMPTNQSLKIFMLVSAYIDGSCSYFTPG